MSKKWKTAFNIEQNRILKDGKNIGLEIREDYLFYMNKQLNIYIEDNYFFSLQRVIPFLAFPKISTPIGLSVENGNEIWCSKKDCDLDDLVFKRHVAVNK